MVKFNSVKTVFATLDVSAKFADAAAAPAFAVAFVQYPPTEFQVNTWLLLGLPVIVTLPIA